jgi:hypothetical protein
MWFMTKYGIDLSTEDRVIIQDDGWIWMSENDSAKLEQNLKTRYPNTQRIPIAFRNDCDDLLCLKASAAYLSAGSVQIIHDFASPGWEVDAEFASIQDWLGNKS